MTEQKMMTRRLLSPAVDVAIAEHRAGGDPHWVQAVLAGLLMAYPRPTDRPRTTTTEGRQPCRPVSCVT